jgi:multidrug resistance efflux pump
MKDEPIELAQINLQESSALNSEEVQEIITAVPSWILRGGISIIFLVLLSIVALSAFIDYPDIVKTNLKINSLNAPKSVFAKQTGKIMSLLVKEGDYVKQGSPLAFMESTASHRDVMHLRQILELIGGSLDKQEIYKQGSLKSLNLGELQTVYQNFHLQYLLFVSTQRGGYYLNRKAYLERDLQEIVKLKEQIVLQQEIQKREFKNIYDEYEAYKKLKNKGVISKSEFIAQENKYLSGNYPLQQSVTALLNNSSTYAQKQKEILELDHTIQDERAKFVQGLNNMITQTDAWLNQYVLRAPVSGLVSFAGIVQENQTVNGNQEIFMINPENADFFGEVQIPQYNMGKVRVGQHALIKMRSYPFEQFGMIRGRISYISDVAFKDSVFTAKITLDHFENKDPHYKMILKNGMRADAEIITQKSSLLQRLLRSITKMLNSN